MAAIRSGVIPVSLTRCLFRPTGASNPLKHIFPERWNQRCIPRSHLHVDCRNPAFKALLGRRHNGRFLLVSAMSVRHNSSQLPNEAVPTATLLVESSSPFSSPIFADPTFANTEEIVEAAPTALDVLQGAGAEVSLAELGLGNATPVGLVQNMLEFLHVDLGVPWWGAIVIGTVLARTLLFPVVVKGQREAMKLNNVIPEVTKINNRMHEAKVSGNQADFAQAFSDLSMFQKKHDVKPLYSFLVPLAQMPVFISFFIGLRQMSLTPVPSMQTGGLLWFPDLTAADPYFILPLAVTGTMFFILELGAESSIDNPNMRIMKTVFRIMPFVILPLTINFPTAVFTYWLTSNCFSLGQVALLKHPLVRQKLGIPERVIHPAGAMPPQEGYAKSLKKTWMNTQSVCELQESQARIKHQLEMAAKDPLKQPFPHSPLEPREPPK